MVEVFKTNVNEECDAEMLLAEIRECYRNCIPNFDLEDCDKILRIEFTANLNTEDLIHLIENFGFRAEILPDTIFFREK